MKPARAIQIITRALAAGTVVFVKPHAEDAMRDEVATKADVLDELAVACAAGDVKPSREHPERWVAFGLYMVVVVELNSGVVVVTVFGN